MGRQDGEQRLGWGEKGITSRKLSLMQIPLRAQCCPTPGAAGTAWHQPHYLLPPPPSNPWFSWLGDRVDGQRQMGTEWIRQKSQQIAIDEGDADRDRCGQTKAGTPIWTIL